MLVRSPLLTNYGWRELVSSGHLVCRCYDAFLWCHLCFVLLRFRLYAFIETAAHRSIVLRHAGAPIATRVSLFFIPFVCLEMMLLFPSNFFVVPLPFSLCILESTSSVFPFRTVFFYLVTTSWIFDIISAYVRIHQSIIINTCTTVVNCCCRTTMYQVQIIPQLVQIV